MQKRSVADGWYIKVYTVFAIGSCLPFQSSRQDEAIAKVVWICSRYRREPFSPSKSSRDETTSKGENAFSFLSTSASTIKDIQCGETWHIQLPNNKKKELDYWQKANKTCKQDKLALSLPSFAGETLLLCCILYYPTLHKLYEKSLGEESGRSWNESFFFCPNKIVRCLRLMMAIQVGPPMVHWLINGAFLLLPFRKSLASISSQGATHYQSDWTPTGSMEVLGAYNS